MSDPTGSVPPGDWRPGDPPPGAGSPYAPAASPYAPASLGGPASTTSNPAGRTALGLGIVALVCWVGFDVAENIAFTTGSYSRTVFQLLRAGGWVSLILALAALGTGIYALRRTGPRGAAGVGAGIGLTLVVLWLFSRLITSLALSLW
ncbi:hypothetical protein EXU48_00420 [Occultella glacieicola]|uniref:Uncharacterized protein n=1 Tax=Occultella glacieicola TaxID=2518684 RepID=A0ABY2E8K6_9MICO|nr:hypothetical protein [Occultella glacieicola]TDE98716.1 hypothetical protein EXU48_00420 [Occultella glacieicola]